MCITNAFGRFAPPNIDVCVCVYTRIQLGTGRNTNTVTAIILLLARNQARVWKHKLVL